MAGFAAVAIAHVMQDNNRTSSNGQEEDDSAHRIRVEQVKKKWKQFEQALTPDEMKEIMDERDKSLQELKEKRKQSNIDRDKNITDVNIIHGNLVNLIRKHIDTGKYTIDAPRSSTGDFTANVTFTTAIASGNNKTFRLITFTGKKGSDKYQAYLIHYPDYEANGRFDIPITPALQWLQIDKNTENAPTQLEKTLKSLSEYWIPIVTMFTTHTAWKHTFEIGTTESAETNTLYNMHASSTRSSYTPREVTIHQAAAENSFIVTQGKIAETVPFTDMDTKITGILSIHAPRMPWNEQYNDQHLRLITLID